jgi:hypothetical protein
LFGFIVEPKAYGDGNEYLLQTESFRNHGSPELRIEDFQSLKERVSKHQQWESFHRNDQFQKRLDIYAIDSTVHFSGYYFDLDGDLFCYHFWFYSLLNVPTSYIVELFSLPPNYAYSLFHFILLFILFYYILFKFQKNGLNDKTRILLCLLIFFSPIAWYLKWIHTEFYTSVFVIFSFLLSIDKKYFWALFLSSLAAIHFQPLFMLSLFYVFLIIKEYRLTLKSLLKIGIASFWVIVPSFFYYSQYGVPNIIIREGFLSNDRVTLNRFFGFFFDLDQGMVIGLPIVLPFAIFFTIYLLLRKKLSIYMLVWVVIILSSIPGLAMLNWNHGMANINRYAVWVSMMVLGLFVFYTIREKLTTLFLLIVVFTQIITFSIQRGFNTNDWDVFRFNKLATFCLNHFPHFYNPDPTIFQQKTNASFEAPLITKYFHKGELIKMLVHRQSLWGLLNMGFDEDDIKRIESKIKFNYDYGYINKRNIPLNVRYKKEESIIKVSCDCENIIIDSTGYISDCGLYLFKNYKKNYSIDKSFSGKNSSVVKRGIPYGMTVYIKDIKEGDHIKATVYKSDKNRGSLVVGDLSNKFKLKSSSIQESMQNDWYKVQLDFVVPEIKDGLKFFVYNPDDEKCYFDDFMIEVKK